MYIIIMAEDNLKSIKRGTGKSRKITEKKNGRISTIIYNDFLVTLTKDITVSEK